MKKSIVATEKAPAAIGPYSQAVRLGEFLFCSGQIPLVPGKGEVGGTDVTQQTRQALDNLKAVLEAGGATLDSVVKTTCFLQNMGDFAAFNEVYAQYFVSDAPARSCVAVAALPRGVLVEVEAIARVVS
jgi:2-iminobutanoate/2-iminopropanoate deaminase